YFLPASLEWRLHLMVWDATNGERQNEKLATDEPGGGNENDEIKHRENSVYLRGRGRACLRAESFIRAARRRRSRRRRRRLARRWWRRLPWWRGGRGAPWGGGG